MVDEYVGYWRGIDLRSLGSSRLEWFSPQDPALDSLWVPHTAPATAQYDPLLLNLLKSVEGSERTGYTRRLSQVHEILSAISLHPDDVVLECFSGPGTLTIPLALKTRRVIAVEADHTISLHLQRRLEEVGITNIEFIVGDIREETTLVRLRERGACKVTKHLHTPGYAVIPETISVCSNLSLSEMTMVLPLSLLWHRWAIQDFPHILQAQLWLASHIQNGDLDILSVHPLRKPSGSASSAIFRLVCYRPITVPLPTARP